MVYFDQSLHIIINVNIVLPLKYLTAFYDGRALAHHPAIASWPIVGVYYNHSASPSDRCHVVKKLITLEPRGIFKSSVYPYI